VKWGKIMNLAITGDFRFSSVPGLASPILPVAPFRTCIWGAIALPAVNKFKGYPHRHPAFSSFFAVSKIFLNKRIGIHWKTPNCLDKPPLFYHNTFILTSKKVWFRQWMLLYIRKIIICYNVSDLLYIVKQKGQVIKTLSFLNILVILIFLILTFYRVHFFVPFRIFAPVYVKCK